MHVLKQMRYCHKNSAQPDAQAKLSLLLFTCAHTHSPEAKDIPKQHARGI